MFDTVNSKCFIGKVLLRMKWKFKLDYSANLLYYLLIFDEATERSEKNFV